MGKTSTLLAEHLSERFLVEDTLFSVLHPAFNRRSSYRPVPFIFVR